MDKFKGIIGEKRIKMASEDSLMKKMELPEGVVSIFGLINNNENDIYVYFDKEITKESRMSFHPNVNTKTIFLDTNNAFKFLENIDSNYFIIDI